MNNYKHTLLVMDKLEFPEDAKKAIIAAEEKIISNEKANKIYESMYRAYWLKKKNFDYFKDKTKALAEEINEHIYTVHLVLLLNCTKPLLAKYKSEGISEEIYWNSILDIKVKTLECKENYDIWGTFVEGWFRGFFNLTRFGLGRFQYDLSDFGEEIYEDNGIVIKDNEFVLGMHIPSHLGALTYDVRMDSYKKAFEFFGKTKGEYIVFMCSSWLVFEGYREVFKEGSNMADFMADFDIIKNDYAEENIFSNSLAVFGMEYNGDTSKFPTDTSLQRNFIKYLNDGKRCGHGHGVIIFDGERIVNNKRDASE